MVAPSGLRSRLGWPAVLLVLVVAYGTAGYTLIEGWSFLDALYMTVMTLSTVGFMEVHPLDAAGRVFTITVIVMGVCLLLVTLSLVAGWIAEGGLGRGELALRDGRQAHGVPGPAAVGRRLHRGGGWDAEPAAGGGARRPWIRPRRAHGGGGLRAGPPPGGAPCRGRGLGPSGPCDAPAGGRSHGPAGGGCGAPPGRRRPPPHARGRSEG